MRAAPMPALFLILTLSLSPAHAAEREIRRDGQLLSLDLHSSFSPGRRDELASWVEQVGEALASVYGRWPRDHWRVRVRPIGAFSSDPVPWAQVNRGDPDRVTFYIDADASLDTLLGNWTAYHEFAHLLIPYRGWGDMWFSEGLASYYQNQLQARAGLFDERTMWQKLYNGFVRGRDNRRPDLALGELSQRMRETGSFMRVYWSGALYFLRADAELRRGSDGRYTLDHALLELNRCCADSALSAWQIAQRLDGIVGRALFVPLYHDARDSLDIGDFESDLLGLGIILEQGEVRLPPGGTGWLGTG